MTKRKTIKLTLPLWWIDEARSAAENPYHYEAKRLLNVVLAIVDKTDLPPTPTTKGVKDGKAYL